MNTRERYEHDAMFHNAVEAMLNMLRISMLTTHDIAGAAVLAAQLYAERYAAPITIVIKREDVSPAMVAALRVGKNAGHGHVWERPDGLRARCGGTLICKECIADLELMTGAAQ